MGDKKKLIKSTLHELFRISTMYQRIEGMPIPVDRETEVSTREAHMVQAVGENRNMSVTQLADYFGITKKIFLIK